MPYRNPAKQREYQRNRARRAKQWFHDFKATLKCEDCGAAHPAIIQFHHVRADKEEGVSRLVNKLCPREQVLKEAAKCAVLCANCHAIRHYDAGYSPMSPRGSDAG
jgi:hypothetical protein